MPKKASGEFNQSQYINEFIKQNYDMFNLKMPKGKKAVVAERAAQKGQSISAYINELIDEDLKKEGLIITEAVCDPAKLTKPKGFLETHKKQGKE